MSLRPEPPELRDTPGGFPASPSNEPASGVISAPHSIAQAVKARKSEFVRRRTVRIKVGTWNVAAISGTEKDLADWFVHGKGVKGLSEGLAGLSVESSPDLTQGAHIESVDDQEQRRRKKKSTVPKDDVAAVPSDEDIGIYVLGLQEIVDISSATEALRPYLDPNPGKKWKHAITNALPSGYKKIAEKQLLGMLLLIYASPEIAPSISSVSTTSVGTGMMGVMGNKGAASARIVLGETTKVVFVDCHLAAGNDKPSLERRNWDTEQILSRTKFDPVTDGVEVEEEYGDSIGDEDFTFWFGDLNYRLEDIPDDDVRRLLLLHTRNEYDVNNKSRRKIDSELGYIDPSSESSSIHSNDHPPPSESMDNNAQDSGYDPSSDPASLQTTIESLLVHDQLRAQQRKRKAFHDGWREGDIHFLPTYKYDVGSVGMFDSGEKKRGPSWCDRILYRSRRDMKEARARLKEELESKKKDENMKARGLDRDSEDDVLFDYDPDTDGLAYGEDYDEDEDSANDAELVQTRDDIEDDILLETYVSHQRILSSDHKPLDAVFTIYYDAIIPELKAKVHQEVVRELDKAENEGRPAVTVVVDNYPHGPRASADGSADRFGEDSHGVEFGYVRYGLGKSRGLTIANTGSVTATFCFIERPVLGNRDEGIAPSWLKIDVEMLSDNANENARSIREYTLSPGDVANVIMTATIKDLHFVRSLNEGQSRLEDILVLRVNRGKDHFIPIRGVWLMSCFGRSVDELTSVPDGGVRSLRTGDLPERTLKKSSTPQSKTSAPRELYALTEAVQELVPKAVAEWDMTSGGREPPWKVGQHCLGWPFEAETWTVQVGANRNILKGQAREALDTATLFSDHLPHETTYLARLEILAETLLEFLSSLEDGIVPAEIWQQMEAEYTARARTKLTQTKQDTQGWITEILSNHPAHNVSFTFLVIMLSKIATDLVTNLDAAGHVMQSPRLSSTSTRSTLSDAEEASSSLQEGVSKSSIFSPFRRRNRGSTSSMGNADPPESEGVRRSGIEHALCDILAGVMIRPKISHHIHGRERRAMQEKRRLVLAPFMITS